MSTTEHHEYAEMNVEAAHHDHPSERTYIIVAAVLAVFTAIEVALSYIDVNDRITVGALLFFALLKFVAVVGYFMHLKFDHPWFRRLFVTGLILAGFCYFVYLSTLRVFD